MIVVNKCMFWITKTACHTVKQGFSVIELLTCGTICPQMPQIYLLVCIDLTIILDLARSIF